MMRLLQSNPYSSLKEFFDQNGVRPQIVDLDSSKAYSIKGRKGSIFYISNNAFLDSEGNLPKGKIEFYFKEIFNRSEMVLSNKFSTSADQFMESLAQIYIQASYNGELLKLREPIHIQLPHLELAKGQNNPRLFQASKATSKAFSFDQAFDWQRVPKRGISLKKEGKERFYSFQVERMNWYACNVQPSKKQKQDMLSIKYHCKWGGLEQGVAFLFFQKHNAVARMYPQGQSFTSFNIPHSESVYAIIIGVKEEQLFWGELFIPKISNMTHILEVKPKNEAHVLQRLASLES